MVTHPCINQAHDCLTTVIKHKMFTPCYVSPHNTGSHTQKNSPDTSSTLHPDVLPQISEEATLTPKPLTADRLETLLQMQRTDPFCKCISKHLLNSKAPQHEIDIFTHVRGLLYKHIMDTGKQFLSLIIPKSWKYTVLVEAHDKLGHQ